MSSIWGDKIKVSLFGESHGAGIGVVIDGLPPGFELDMDKISAHMKRRAPGDFPWSTRRKEADIPEILSGFFNGKTCGTPLAAVIRNTDTRPIDYSDLIAKPRPGHADITGRLRYKGANDPRGGGHFSGRITAPLTFAGAICLQILESHGVEISAHIKEIAGIPDKPDAASSSIPPAQKTFPVYNDEQGELMKQAIQDAFFKTNSVGGIIEVTATNFPAGLGDPFFYSIESRVSAIMFSIPAVKGIEFGKGFEVARSTGSENNDTPVMIDGNIISRKTNNSGGIEGGISNGMPIIVRCAFKPTSSIALEQDTVNLETMKNDKVSIRGRHDPCVVPRAVPVVESALAIALLNLLV
ncbi:MAG: chorismate synthase [Lentisphaerae bacterium]|jgi:chorismate synthase|nr:chorismate synthase [Lentisphaerota bacterium]